MVRRRRAPLCRAVDVVTVLLSISSFSSCVNEAAAWIIRSPLVISPSPMIRTQELRMTATTTANPTARVPLVDATTDTVNNIRPSSTVIIGGGPTGIFTALMLARKGYKGITVLERLAEPPPPASSEWGNPERSYNLGIGGRGQVALAKIGAAGRVFSWCAEAVGRRDWSPQAPEGSERIFSERKFQTKVIARDRLASCLLEEAREAHPNAVSFRFGVECTAVKWLEPEGGTGGTLTLTENALNGAETSELTAEFVIAADGVRSEVRDALERDRELTKALSGSELLVNRFPRRNEFVYKVVPFRLDSSWRNDFNYSHRTKEDINLEALPTKEGMQVGVLLFRPDNQRVLGIKTAADAQSAAMAVALAAAAPVAAAGTSTRVFPAVLSKDVAEAPTSSAGAASTAVPSAAPAAGGTVFPTASVGGAARVPAFVDKTVALTVASATGGTVLSAASVGGASASSAVAATSVESAAEPAISGTVPSAASVREAVGGRESSAGAVSSDAAVEAAPSTGGTADPVESAAWAVRKLALAAGSAGLKMGSQYLRREGGIHPPL